MILDVIFQRVSVDRKSNLFKDRICDILVFRVQGGEEELEKNVYRGNYIEDIYKNFIYIIYFFEKIIIEQV